MRSWPQVLWINTSRIITVVHQLMFFLVVVTNVYQIRYLVGTELMPADTYATITVAVLPADKLMTTVLTNFNLGLQPITNTGSTRMFVNKFFIEHSSPRYRHLIQRSQDGGVPSLRGSA
ncbi:hypothetical protein DOA17_03075 [Salmonella enterica subsp. enterica serovar Virchow]|nr:hypothetical protein [Salmonella enterica subsp. enterica serovar Virchow]